MTGKRWAEVRGESTEENEKHVAEIDMLHALALETPKGRELMTYLRQISIERRNAPGDSYGALSELEAQRRFVANIEMRIKRHRQRVLAQAQKAKDGDGRNDPGRTGK